MGEFVLYALGAASGVEQDGDIERGIAVDDAHAAAHIRALRQSGHTVVQVGDARNGFTLPELAAAVRDYPYATTFIFSIHGNEQSIDGTTEGLRHSVRLGPKPPQPEKPKTAADTVQDEDDKYFANDQEAEEDDAGCCFVGDVFQTVTENNFGQPVNIFLFSCGSRHAYKDSDQLPLGSTIVAFTSLKDYRNTSPDWRGFSVPYIRARNFAEQLCLNIQAYSMVGCENILDVAVCRADLPVDCRAYNMWDLAFTAGFTEPHYDMPADFVRTMREECLQYMGDGTYNEMMETFQLFARNLYSNTVVEGRRTKVKPKLTTRMDVKDFRDQVEHHNLMHAVGVYAYLLAERHEPMGAFQTQPPEFYTLVPPKRPNPLDRLGLGADGVAVLEKLIAETGVRNTDRMREALATSIEGTIKELKDGPVG